MKERIDSKEYEVYYEVEEEEDEVDDYIDRLNNSRSGEVIHINFRYFEKK